MIKDIRSSLSTFKTLEFHPGLNLLLAQKEPGATDKQTRNGAGKSSMVEIIHFLLGGKLDKTSIFKQEPLIHESFSMHFDLQGQTIGVERSGELASKVKLSGNLPSRIHGEADILSPDQITISTTDWTNELGQSLFHLSEIQDFSGRKPTFRSLFSYFARRHPGGFTTPEKHAVMQHPVDVQTTLLYLLGFDWRIASEWQVVRDQEKTLKELKKAANEGAFGQFVGKSSELRTSLTILEDRAAKLHQRLKTFNVLPEYKTLESEADEITKELGALSDNNTLDLALIRDLKQALETENPPQLVDLDAIYKEAGIILPTTTLQRYEDVRSFHESLIRNRHDYLEGERLAAQSRIDDRKKKQATLSSRRTEIMAILKSHGALDHYTRLQGEYSRLEFEVKSLKKRLEAAEQLEGTKKELTIERSQLELRLRRDFTEQHAQLAKAILMFENISKRLYESAGHLTINPTGNGPVFEFEMQGNRSKGIKNMQIFCFDIMLMQLAHDRGMGPSFLVHDSHLFDGVDGRQVASALKVGAELSEKFGFQYIVTMNEDDAFKETLSDFNPQKHIIPVTITDATDDGGLFGTRF